MSTSGIQRSAVYSYLRPVIQGMRVLEVGCGTGESAAHLLHLGAKSVIGAGSAQELSEARARYHDGALGFVAIAAGSIEANGSFDLILLPDATEILQGNSSLQLATLLKLLGPGGQLVCIVPNGDRGKGVPYYDLVDALTPHFTSVRMFGQTPFLAYGIAEFDEAAAALRVDSQLAAPDDEEPSYYIALAGANEPHLLGYALVQIPALGSDTKPVADRPHPVAGLSTKAPDSALAELRHLLTETEGKAEGLLRVSRAQTEEIEELRARLRRTAEARADLDEEVRRLRRALVEADESVVSLTRKTTEEMTVLAQHLTAGLRPSEAAPGPALTEELRRRESELALRESALSERDDRIAFLEAAKQEATWRADAAEDELGRVRTELASLRSELDLRSAQQPQQEQQQQDEELFTRLTAHETTIEEYRWAAATHVEEMNRLRDAANEQASLVAELQDELALSQKLLAAATQELAQVRAALAEVEGADRQRRSRLSELEGLMLRMEHQAMRESASKSQEGAELEAYRSRAAASEKAATDLRARLTEAESAQASAFGRVEELERQLQASQERERRIGELRAEAPDPEEVYERLFDLETQYQAATMAAARVPSLEAKLAEIEANLAALARS